MNGFIDIHTHILPGVDDGAKHFPEGLELLRMAYANGTRGVIFTPHYRSKYRQNTPELLEKRYQAFCAAAQAELPDMKLYLGQEVYMDSGAPEALAEGRVLSINGTGYALLEFSPGTHWEQMEKGIAAVLRYGYSPILAHGERYAALRKDERRLDQLLDQGVKLQMNADSVMGHLGWEVKGFCKRALKGGKASFIASDAHDPLHRPPLLRECFLHIHKKYGGEYAECLFSANALAVLENRDF